MQLIVNCILGEVFVPVEGKRECGDGGPLTVQARPAAASGLCSSATERRRICMDDVTKMPAMNTATIRSGQRLAVLHTPIAATITAILPMASFREQTHTERTLASPSLKNEHQARFRGRSHHRSN